MTVTAASRRESRCDFGVSHTTPTRPDPTRPLITTRVAGNTTSFRKSPRARCDAMVKALTRPIYHYTCDDHGRPGIERDGVIRPGIDGFAWFTDLDVPHREALGLTMHYTRCDRTAHRFEIDPDDPALTPWTVARRAVPPAYRAALDASPGALLRHWFVAETPVRVIA